MKKLISLFIALISLITLSISVFPVSAKTFSPLDEIQNYDITVSTRKDATLDIEYLISWKVLDDKTDGPLTWVKIGVANKFVDEISTTTPEVVSNIEYYSDNGAFIKLDFKKKYYAGETVEFGFKIHQKRIFTVNDNKQVTFKFIPGWFNEIEVKNIKVKWNKENVQFSNYENSENEFFVWEHSLLHGETIECNVSYSMDVFPDINLKESYSDKYDSPLVALIPIAIFMAVFIIGILAVAISARKNSDGYYRYRGYTYYPYYHIFRPNRGVNSKGTKLSQYDPRIVNSGSSGTGGSHCACACACACAGGGRAGCSRKDFISATVNQFDKTLKK